MFKIKGGINASNQSNIKTTYTFIDGEKKYIFKDQLEYTQEQINQMCDDEYYSPFICAYITNISNNIMTLHVVYKTDNDALSTGISTKDFNLTIPDGYGLSEYANNTDFYNNYWESSYPSSERFNYICRGNKLLILFRFADNTLSFPDDVTSMKGYDVSYINAADVCWYIDDITKDSHASIIFDSTNEYKGVLNTHEGISKIDMQTYGISIEAKYISDYYLGADSFEGIVVGEPKLKFETQKRYYFIPYGEQRNSNIHTYTPQCAFGDYGRIPCGYLKLRTADTSLEGEKISHVTLEIFKDTDKGEVLSGSYNIPINNNRYGFYSRIFIKGNKIALYNGDSTIKTDGNQITKYNIFSGDYEYTNFNIIKNTDHNGLEQDPIMKWSLNVGGWGIPYIYCNDEDFYITKATLNDSSYIRINNNDDLDLSFAGTSLYYHYVTQFYNNNVHHKEYMSSSGGAYNWRWSTEFKQYIDMGELTINRPNELTGEFKNSNLAGKNKNLIYWSLYSDGIVCYTNRLTSYYIDKTAPYTLPEE